MATAADYEWLRPWSRGVLETGYCFTLVRLSPAVLLDRLVAGERTMLHGFFALGEPSMEAWNQYGGASMVVGVTGVGEWSFMAEVNGFIGVTAEAMASVSAGTTSVSHYRSVNADDRFLWLEDGEVRLTFEPLFPSQRWGTAADDVRDEMTAAGFDLRTGEERSFEFHTEAAFALAERLTGVRVTPELLDDSTFECGVVTLAL